jgi:hypothetical protein
MAIWKDMPAGSVHRWRGEMLKGYRSGNHEGGRIHIPRAMTGAYWCLYHAHQIAGAWYVGNHVTFGTTIAKISRDWVTTYEWGSSGYD